MERGFMQPVYYLVTLDAFAILIQFLILKKFLIPSTVITGRNVTGRNVARMDGTLARAHSRTRAPSHSFFPDYTVPCT